MKRATQMAGAAVLVIAAGAAGAWLTWPPQTVLPRLSEAAGTTHSPTAQPAPAAAPTIALPEAAPPPEPTSTDFGGVTAAASTPPTAAAQDKDPASIDWPAMPIDEVRNRASADDVTAMEELARRLVQGVGITKDQQAGAGWLLRAAQRGSAQSAFNVGVMYERGFVVERDSTKAIEWYRKAVDANLPMAKHNLALLLRDGKGAPRNVKEAVELLRSAARQGMTASMFTLGDIYERGDADVKDPAIALAWFAITAEFEHQTNRGAESQLMKIASQRVQALQRILLPGELERAQQFGQAEFKQIVETLQPPKPSPPPPPPAETGIMPKPALPPMMAVEPDVDSIGWPKAATEQVRVIQQALVDLKLLRDKPDGAVGPMTRNAIRAFERIVGIRETGEPTRDVFVALQEAQKRRDAGAKAEAAKPETAPAESAKAEDAKAESAKIDAAKAADVPTPKDDAEAWPQSSADQIKAVQALLLQLNFSREAPDGVLGPATRTAIREYERLLGLTQTGEPGKSVFDSLKEVRSIAKTKPN
ncbi:MAG: SEL1-like repeat protein [Reyranella sp.]|nr:SEL1-like repeat protein [Reyranella sp.]MBL6650004.1 SEL1-like repeat protein [Reyranella sp.]